MVEGMAFCTPPLLTCFCLVSCETHVETYSGSVETHFTHVLRPKKSVETDFEGVETDFGCVETHFFGVFRPIFWGAETHFGHVETCFAGCAPQVVINTASWEPLS